MSDWFDMEKTIHEQVRRRVLTEADFRCGGCGCEEGRSILRRYTDWGLSRAWVEATGETLAARAWDSYLVHVRLIVWTDAWPWNGDLARLRPLCIGCLIQHLMASAIPMRESRPRRPTQSTLAFEQEIS
jgi:hypothetical protein